MSRQRRYHLVGMDHFRNPEIGYFGALLEEASERLYDVLHSADKRQLHFVPEGTYLSMAKLAKHMIWGEAVWIQRLGKEEMPAYIGELLGDMSPNKLDAIEKTSESAAELIDTGKGLRADFSLPVLRSLRDLDMKINAPRGPDTVRQILTHVLWHWTYHSGQVGLLLLQGGYDYQWEFERNA